MLNKNIMEGKWNEIKGNVQRQWGKLTDDDMDQINGNRKELLGRLQKNYGLAEAEAEKQVKEWETKTFN